jgi:hypothetical protein
MGAQSNGQQGGQVYWDADTGQAYTQTSTPKNSMAKLFMRMQGINPGQKNYLAKFGLNNISAVDAMLEAARQEAMQRNTPTFADLFPQLAQSQYTQPTQTQQAPVSSGAGRFMGNSK